MAARGIQAPLVKTVQNTAEKRDRTGRMGLIRIERATCAVRLDVDNAGRRWTGRANEQPKALSTVLESGPSKIGTPRGGPVRFTSK